MSIASTILSTLSSIESFLKNFMQHYLNKNRTPSTGDSVREIRLACVHGDITTVQTFLRHLQIDVGRTYSDLSALLLLACRNGQANIAQLLLDHGAKINQTGYLGETALSAACNMGHKDIVELLLKTPGVEVDTAPNPSQRTPLIQACQKGYVDIARLLLNHGANPDLPDKQGKTALDYAFEMGHENVIELLLNIPGAFTWRRSNYELLYRLKKRGYALSGRGVCNGVAETSGQEFLFYEDSEKFVTMFNQRYELLLSFNREKFSEELDRYYSSHPEKKQEIEPFLDSVALQQDPNVFSYLFDEDADVTQSNRNAAPLFTPTNKSTERKEGKDTSIMTFASFSGVYDDEELTVYLNLLQEHLGAHRFSMVLRSNQHAINLNYDPDKKKWFLINANTLPISRIVGTEILTQNILKGFFSNTNAIISTRISCQEHEADNFQEKFEELKTDSRWKAIHNPKKPSAISVSKKGSTWLNIACQNKEIETVRLLLTESNIDINKADSYGYTPLSNVCRNGCTPIFKLLLEQGNTLIDVPVCLTQLNTEEKISVLPEDIASQRGYQDIVELFNKKKYLVLMDSINALALEPTHDAARHIAIKKLQAYAVQTYKNNQLSFKERYNLLKTASTQLTSLDQMTSQLMQIESKYTGKNRHRKKSVSHIKTAVENAYKRYLSDEDVISTEALLLEDILTIKKAVDLHHSTEGTRARFFGKSTTESRLSTIIRETLDSGPKKH